ncbi:MAG: hypothetical protein WAU08_03645 [Flavobacteriales bacterium]|jgi:hypothetical protein|nr:hypothetical protein [Flavobacteriales bacterium]
MNSKILMVASAAVLAAVGIAFSFAPEETLAFFGKSAPGAVPVLLQLAGGLYLGFAFMNWTAKASVLGGIYGRAIVLGNFLQFTMGALTLLKAASGNSEGIFVWVAAGGYALFAVLFGVLLFSSPRGQ